MSDGPSSAGEPNLNPDNAQPVVQLPSGGPPLSAVLAGFGVLAVGLFLTLEGHRHQAEAPAAPSGVAEGAGVISPAPPLVIPPPPTPAPLPQPQVTPPQPEIRYVDRPGPSPPPVIQYIPQPAPPPSRPIYAQATSAKQLDPALVIDMAPATPADAAATDEAPVHAALLRNRAFLVPQGSLIPAVLETPINSTRPGPVRALTSSDTRGFDGTRVLIPRGSRLVGEFHSDVQAGQSRVLVTWDRVVRPDGVVIRLASPASDSLGGIGIGGNVNNHFLARFSSVLLQSAFTAGTNLASNPGNGSIVIGAQGGQAFANAGQTLVPSADLKPTITIKEGTIITVFVAKDLDFGGV